MLKMHFLLECANSTRRSPYMNYTHTESDGQLAFSETRFSLSIPSRLDGFNNSDTTVSRSVSGREVFS